MANSLECCGNTFCDIMVPGRGSRKSDIMFVGEAPGEDEVAQEAPFVGKAGRFLTQRLFPNVALRESEVYLQNAVRCFPGRDKKGKIRNPSAENIRKCRPNLVEEVQRVKPKVIVAMGNAALHGCLELARWRDDEKKKDTQVTGITRWRGKRVWHPEFNCWVVFTYHPSFLMRLYKFQKFEYNQTIDDLEFAIQSVNDVPSVKKLQGILLLSNPELAYEYLKRVLYGKRFTDVAVDSETTTVDYREIKKVGKDALLGISMSVDEPVKTGDYRATAVYIPHKTLFQSSVVALFQSILVDKQKRKLWHNVAFDERVLRSVGFAFGGIDDYNHVCTMMAAKLLDENFTVGLKDLVWRFLTFGGYEKPLDDFRREHKAASFADVPVKQLAKYAAIDALATKRIWTRVLLPGLQAEGLDRLFLRTLARVRMVFTSFEIVGLKVDRERARAISKRCVAMRAKLEKRMYKLAGREFKMSYQQLGKIIYEDMKVKVISKTPTGQPATDSDTMIALLKKRIPKRARIFIQSLLDIKYIDKMLSTYVDKVEKVVWEDGRVHTRFNLTGTVTGRPSSSDPNIANVPKDGWIRSLYIPEPGKVFLECDMGAAELRVLAQYAKEPTMIRAFKTGDDLHEETARAIYGKPKDYKPAKVERDRGKRVNFGSVYGISAKELAHKFEVSVQEAEKFLARFFKRYHRVAKWLEDNAAFGKRNGYVISFFKRKRRIPNLKSDSFRDQARAIRQANNAGIQSCASDLCYVAMVRAYYAMQKAKLEARMVHSVYDSVLIELPKSEVPQVKRILKRAFETPVEGLPDFLMTVDFNVTDRWGKDYPSKLAEVLKQVPWDEREAA